MRIIDELKFENSKNSIGLELLAIGGFLLIVVTNFLEKRIHPWLVPIVVALGLLSFWFLVSESRKNKGKKGFHRVIIFFQYLILKWKERRNLKC